MQTSQPSPSPSRPDIHTLRGWSDEQLFLASQEGHQLAFRTLVERHVAFVRRLAENVVRDEHEAEDVVQETFVSAWRNRHGWRPEARFTTWLYRIAMNRAIDRYRSRRAAPQAQEVIAAMIDRDVETSKSPEQQEGLERKEASTTLRAALGALPGNQKRALELFYFDDFEVAKIASMMAVSEQSVRALLKRGRQTLKHRLRNQRSLLADGSGELPRPARAPRR